MAPGPEKIYTEVVDHISGHLLGPGRSENDISLPKPYHMMMTWHGNFFCITGPLWGEYTSHNGFPSRRASNTELCCFLWCWPAQAVKQFNGRICDTMAFIWCNCDDQWNFTRKLTMISINIQTVFPGVPIIKIRQSWNCLICILGIPIEYRWNVIFILIQPHNSSVLIHNIIIRPSLIRNYNISNLIPQL